MERRVVQGEQQQQVVVVAAAEAVSRLRLCGGDGRCGGDRSGCIGFQIYGNEGDVGCGLFVPSITVDRRYPWCSCFLMAQELSVNSNR